MARWLNEIYNYNLAAYTGLSQVGLPSPVTPDCNRSLDKVVSYDGIVTRERWYIIPNDAELKDGNV